MSSLMFIPTGAAPPAYSFGPAPFMTFGLPYQPAAAPPPTPVGYTYTTPELQQNTTATRASSAASPFGNCPTTPLTFSQNSSTSSFAGNIAGHHIICNTANPNGSNGTNIGGNHNSSGFGGDTRNNHNRCKEHKHRLSSSLASQETSSGILPSNAWGLSMTSMPSSAASSVTAQPYYVVLQPHNSMMSPLGVVPGMPPHHASNTVTSNINPNVNVNGVNMNSIGATPDNGTMYELGEWYEGVVKRYNPMRGFGFLTATHHLCVVSPKHPTNSTTAASTNIITTTTSASGVIDKVLEGSTTTTTTTTTTNAIPRTTEMPAESNTWGGDTTSDMVARVVRTPVTLGDIFVHQSYIQMQGFRALSIGDRVVFRIGVLQGKRAHQAVSVQRINENGVSESSNTSNTTTTTTPESTVPTTGGGSQYPVSEKSTKSAFYTRGEGAVTGGFDETVFRLLGELNPTDMNEPHRNINHNSHNNTNHRSGNPNGNLNLTNEVHVDEFCLSSPLFGREPVAFHTADDCGTPATNGGLDMTEADEMCDFLGAFEESYGRD